MIPTAKTESIRLADWSGFTDLGGTAEAYAPRDETEIVELVRYCRDNQKKLRVVGLQTSWNTLWYCQDVMMTTKHLNTIIEINVPNRTITCETGTTLEQIHNALWERGLTLNTAPSVDWVTVGGAISTGSHGSGPASISSSMIGCRLVTADGNVIEIGEGDELLDAVRGSVGALGVLSTVTLKVVNAFHVSMQRTRILTHDCRRFLTEGEMSYLLWFPHTEHSVLARVDVISDPAEAQRRAEAASSEGFDINNPEHFERLVQRLGMDVTEQQKAAARLATAMPSTIPGLNRYMLEVLYQDMELVGPAHEVLMSFQSEPIAGAEWSVPISRFPAAFADLQAEIKKGDFYLPLVWLKKVMGESAWLSAADEDSVQCGIYHNVFADSPSLVKEMVMRVERLMLRHGGRPHLGKLIYLDPADLKRVYPN
ncbi:MAG: FAD-binding protein [Deltaproteobacteria bacterium]|nr:FAD-binding protein [Deltaproteobacteria bacterium]